MKTQGLKPFRRTYKENVRKRRKKAKKKKKHTRAKRKAFTAPVNINDGGGWTEVEMVVQNKTVKPPSSAVVAMTAPVNMTTNMTTNLTEKRTNQRGENSNSNPIAKSATARAGNGRLGLSVYVGVVNEFHLLLDFLLVNIFVHFPCRCVSVITTRLET